MDFFAKWIKVFQIQIYITLVSGDQISEFFFYT